MAHPTTDDARLLALVSRITPERLGPFIDGLTPAEVAALTSALDGWRPQMAGPPLDLMPHQNPPPGDWWLWLLAGGRGAGKSLAGAAWLDEQARTMPGSRWFIVAPTRPDARNICVEGESGLLALNPTIVFNKSNYTLRWPNGSTARLFGAYTAEDRQRLRGHQANGAWLEEFGAWRQLDERPSPMDPDCYEAVTIACRLGDRPRIAVTTTPKRRQRLVDLYDKAAAEPADVVMTHARMVDNPHLSAAYRERLLAMYEGTTLGAQELDGQLIDAVDGALLDYASLDAMLVKPDALPTLARRIVAVDPATTDRATSDETGIIVAGQGTMGGRTMGATLADLSGRHPVSAPSGTWAHVAVEAYHEWDCVAVVAESNQGGDLVREVIRNIDPSVPVRLVRASVGKRARAEPVAAAARTGRWWHAATLPELREQWATWDPSLASSPDRLDAEVWAAHFLILGVEGVGDVTSVASARKDRTARPGGLAARRKG